MPSRKELQDLAKLRLKEAKVLYENGLYDGAWYLAGYVVELALKARICRVLDRNYYPDSGEISRAFKTHNHDDLLTLAGLEEKLVDACLNDTDLLSNWSVVTQWNESFRYEPVETSEKVKVQEAIAALEDSTNGVLTWLKKYW